MVRSRAMITPMTQSSGASAATPAPDAAAGSPTVAIDWADGHHTVYQATPLRWLCPCAFCRGEAGMPGWLDSGPSLTDEQTRLVDVSMVGGYAIAPAWADGHHTGYYTFTMLR